MDNEFIGETIGKYWKQKNDDTYVNKEEYEEQLGDTDISSIGDGTVTGAISTNAENIATNEKNISQNASDIAANKSDADSKYSQLNSALAALGSAFQITRFTYDSISLDSGSTTSITISTTTPSGYTAIGVAGFFTGGLSFAASRVNLVSGGVYISMRNNSTSSQSGTPWAEVLFVKTSLL